MFCEGCHAGRGTTAGGATSLLRVVAQRETNLDARSAKRAGVYVQHAAEQPGTFFHADQAQPGRTPQVAGGNADAVVVHAQQQVRSAHADQHVGHASARVLVYVVDGFLHDPEQAELLFVVEPGRVFDAAAQPQSTAGVALDAERVQRAGQAGEAQDAGVQLMRNGPDVIGDRQQLVLQFHHAGPFLQRNVVAQRAEPDRDRGQRLVDVIVQVARDARAFFFLHHQHAPGHFAQASVSALQFDPAGQLLLGECAQEQQREAGAQGPGLAGEQVAVDRPEAERPQAFHAELHAEHCYRQHGDRGAGNAEHDQRPDQQGNRRQGQQRGHHAVLPVHRPQHHQQAEQHHGQRHRIPAPAVAALRGVDDADHVDQRRHQHQVAHRAGQGQFAQCSRTACAAAPALGQRIPPGAAQRQQHAGQQQEETQVAIIFQRGAFAPPAQQQPCHHTHHGEFAQAGQQARQRGHRDQRQGEHGADAGGQHAGPPLVTRGDQQEAQQQWAGYPDHVQVQLLGQQGRQPLAQDAADQQGQGKC